MDPESFLAEPGQGDLRGMWAAWGEGERREWTNILGALGVLPDPNPPDFESPIMPEWVGSPWYRPQTEAREGTWGGRSEEGLGVTDVRIAPPGLVQAVLDAIRRALAAVGDALRGALQRLLEALSMGGRLFLWAAVALLAVLAVLAWQRGEARGR